MARQFTLCDNNLQSGVHLVNCAAVLAVGFEPTRAFAQQSVKLLRLPVPPRQHLNQQANRGSQEAKTHEQHTLFAEPQVHAS